MDHDIHPLYVEILENAFPYSYTVVFPKIATPTTFFAVFRVTFLMPRVRFKPITWYIEMHHERKFFVWRHDFFALRDHSQHVYLQEESLPPFVSCRMRLKNCSEFVLIIFYLQLINSGHVDSSMANKKHGKLCLIIEDKRCE